MKPILPLQGFTAKTFTRIIIVIAAFQILLLKITAAAAITSAMVVFP
jgi:hypothetical protein